MEECESFIKDKRESKYLKTSECQKIKFERLCHKYGKIEGGHSNIQHGEHDEIATHTVSESNIKTSHTDKIKDNSTNSISTNSTNNTWVRNISSTPIMEV